MGTLQVIQAFQIPRRCSNEGYQFNIKGFHNQVQILWRSVSDLNTNNLVQIGQGNNVFENLYSCSIWGLRFQKEEDCNKEKAKAIK